MVPPPEGCVVFESSTFSMTCSKLIHQLMLCATASFASMRVIETWIEWTCGVATVQRRKQLLVKQHIHYW